MHARMYSELPPMLGAHAAGARRFAAWNDGRRIPSKCYPLTRGACSDKYWKYLCKKRTRAIRKSLPRDAPVRMHHNIVKV